MATRPNKSMAKDRDTQAIFGIDKHLSAVSSLTLDGTAYTPAELKSLLQSDVDSADAATRAKAAWQLAVAGSRTLRARVRKILSALKSYLISVNGRDAVALLADFGFTPPKQGKAGVKTKAAAVDKTLATRQARHTMGTRQRGRVKGNVPPPVGSPAGGGASPARLG
jgi:hypothetical protein